MTTPSGSPAAGRRSPQAAKASRDLPANAFPQWSILYKAAGTCALAMFVLIPIQMVIYTLWPPPPYEAALFFDLIQSSPLLGWLSLDGLYLVDMALFIVVYLGLYAALRTRGESLMAIGLALGLVATAVYYSSNTAFEMLRFSAMHAAAATDAERTIALAAGEVMLSAYEGTAFNVYYILSAISLLLISLVMLREARFGRAAGWLGLAAALLMFVPPTVPVVGLWMALASLLPLAVWLLLIARAFFRLA